MDEPIEIRPYDARWPEVFHAEAARIGQALRPYVLAIEHVGSTSVPGLPGKDVVDIMVAIYRLSDAPRLVPKMEALGYTYRPELEAEIPDRRFFKRRRAGQPAVNVHMVEAGSAMWERDRLFRDYLRAHPEEAAAYAAHKRELAARHGGDLPAYTKAKTEFIQAAHAKARAEAEARRLERLKPEDAAKSPPG